MPAGRKLPTVTKNRNYPQPVKYLKPMALAPDRSFKDLMRYGFGDGTWPTSEDFKLHLCQVWPHVPPRNGLLELRASDGLLWPYFSAAPAIWVGLTYDAEVRKEATAYLSDLTASQLERSVDDIAEKGLYASVGLHEVRKPARELLRLARCGLQKRVDANIDPAEALLYLEPLEQVSEGGETFADRCIMSWLDELERKPQAYVEKYRIPFN
jgi:glutamate--cysteine ligase